MICPLCKNAIDDDASFCKMCGKRIPRCPTCGMVLSKPTRFCGKDGTAIPASVLDLFAPAASVSDSTSDTAAAMSQPTQSAAAQPAGNANRRFCRQCGQPCAQGQVVCDRCKQRNMAQQAAMTAHSTAPKKGKGGLIAVIAIVAVLAVLIGGVGTYYFINRELPFPFQSERIANESESAMESDKADDRTREESQGNNTTETTETTELMLDPGTTETYETDPMSIILFSNDVAKDIGASTVLGGTIKQAVSEGWATAWITYYYYGDEGEQASENRTRGIPIETWLRNYATYEKAKEAGWGDAWLVVAVNVLGDTANAPYPLSTTDRFVDYIHHCDTKSFSIADIEGFDESMALLARNAPYAHEGRKFAMESLSMFFNNCSWYYPNVEPADFNESMLNKNEIANINLVVSYQAEKGFQ